MQIKATGSLYEYQAKGRKLKNFKFYFGHVRYFRVIMANCSVTAWTGSYYLIHARLI